MFPTTSVKLDSVIYFLMIQLRSEFVWSVCQWLSWFTIQDEQIDFWQVQLSYLHPMGKAVCCYQPIQLYKLLHISSWTFSMPQYFWFTRITPQIPSPDNGVFFFPFFTVQGKVLHFLPCFLTSQEALCVLEDPCLCLALTSESNVKTNKNDLSLPIVWAV